MDSEFEELHNGTDTANAIELYNRFHTILMFTSSAIGMLSAVIIAYTILRVRRMRTRTNLLVVHWAINDAFFMLSTIILYFLMETDMLDLLERHGVSFCIVAYMDVAFKFISTVFIAILISTTMMKSTRISDRTMLLTFYGIAVIFSIINFCFCVFSIRMSFIYLLVGLLFVAMIPVMLIKEINQCYKRRKDPLSKETVYRLNIGRLYIYNWFIGSIFVILVYSTPFGVATPKFLELFFLSGFLSSLYILLYLVICDRKFRMSLLSGLHLAADTYDVDAAIRFEENEGDNDDGSVNISTQQS